MSNENIKIAGSNLGNISEQISKKNNENGKINSLKKKKVNIETKSADITKEDENKLKFINKTTDFKTYKFNGKIANDESYLGSNFDVYAS